MTASKMNDKISLTGKVYILRNLVSVIMGGAIFFLAAGRLDIYRGWIYFIISFLAVTTANLIIGNLNPQLLEQRSRIQAGSKKWDKWWLLIFAIGFVYGMPLVAGLEIGRLNHDMNSWTILAGMVLYLLSVIFSTWAMSVNRFFEPSVRIQKERNHTVITGGPYAFVRHPGYFALVLWAIAFPLIVGSYYTLVQGLILIVFVASRTYWEDKTLLQELDGYTVYKNNVRYRLIPGLW
jgi:protein-S-isoprenylcysteine O-methyltransferase Ste14